MLILASTSPRRIELVKTLGIEYKTVSPNFDEDTINPTEYDVLDYVKLLALKKAESLSGKFYDDTILAADTIVTIDNEVLNKPVNQIDAFNQLKKLSGRTHYVITGVCLIKKEKTLVFYDQAEVTFKEITADEIEAYIKTGEPMDKSGSYAIQGIASKFIKDFKGDVNTIIGLPIKLVAEKINTLI